ncbi:retrotransposon protein, putative, ty1-copia subclass [Tanacetum coccineum]
MDPTKKVDKTPYELCMEKFQTCLYLKVLGMRGSVKRDTPYNSNERSVKCINFKDTPKETMGLLLLLPPENKIVCCKVEGFEPPQEEVIPIRRSERPHRAPNRLCLNVEVEEHSLGDLNEPASIKPQCWIQNLISGIEAITAEMTIHDGQSGMVPGRPTSWLQVYTQLYGFLIKKRLPPVADIRAIRILISIAAYYDYEIWQMDVKTTFLNGYLDEDIYMVQPEGFVDPNHPRKDLEEAAFILRIKIYRDRSKRLIGLWSPSCIGLVALTDVAFRTKYDKPIQQNQHKNIEMNAIAMRIETEEMIQISDNDRIWFSFFEGGRDWKSPSQKYTAMSLLQNLNT